MVENNSVHARVRHVWRTQKSADALRMARQFGQLYATTALHNGNSECLRAGWLPVPAEGGETNVDALPEIEIT